VWLIYFLLLFCFDYTNLKDVLKLVLLLKELILFSYNCDKSDKEDRYFGNSKGPRVFPETKF